MARLLGARDEANVRRPSARLVPTNCRTINLITPVRLSEADEIGLDEAMHGESAYILDDDNAPAPVPAGLVTPSGGP